MAILVGVTIILAGVALYLGWNERHKRPVQQADAFAMSDTHKVWVSVAILFIVQVVGVVASFYLTARAFGPQQNVWLLSLILAAASFGGAISGRDSHADISPPELFQFFKDGLLWPATLPTLAKALNVV
jgi:hypothetical protein